jgi:hypothetical protein
LFGIIVKVATNCAPHTPEQGLSKPGVKRKQENVATKADKRKYEDKRDRCFQ